MADDSRAPGIRPYVPGEAYRVGIGACLPPRKRLLAGLKQNGWFSSSTSCPQSCNGAGSMEELKLEVDLAETNLEDHGDTRLEASTAGKQGECNAVESSVSVKSRKTSRRRKSLSVLSDRHVSVNELQPEALKSGPGGKIEKKFGTNKISMESVLASNGEKESALSYREMVDAARAAAATAAKVAEQARAIAMDKAAAAAKAAAVAKAALEALTLTARDEEWVFQSSKCIRALRKHKRKGDKLKQELKPKFSLLLTEGGNALSEKRVEEKMSASLDESKEDEQTQIPHVASFTGDMGTGWDKIKEDERTEVPHVLIIDLADAPSDKIKEDEHSHIDHVASPPPPPLDDEKLARQLHRAINSSPRISRYQAPLDCSKKFETAPLSTQGCIQNKDLQAGGCNLSREKKPIHKGKRRFPRASIGRADVKIKSMSAINETLNMLQGPSPSKYRILKGSSAASEEHVDNICVKEDLLMPIIPSHSLASLANCNEEGDKLTVNGDSVSSCKFDTELRSKKASCYGHPDQPDVAGTVDKLRSIKWVETIKKQKSSSKISTGVSLIAEFPGMIQCSLQCRDSNGIGEVSAMSAENHSATLRNAVLEPTGPHLETLNSYGSVGRYENQDRIIVPGLGSTQGAGGSVDEMRNNEENTFCLKSSRTTRKRLLLSSHEDTHTQCQKVSNGLSKGNQNFEGSMNLSSPTVS